MSSKVKADPTKAFFVRMLTRDISLDDCILDLIDNSIDGAWAHSGQDPAVIENSQILSDYQVDIRFNAETFSISDNCGGITLDNATDYAFTFGRDPNSLDNDTYSVGVYGIGMKRAVFKIGNDVRIQSTYADESGVDSFVVPINVGEWMKESTPPWDFDLEQATPSSELGVRIDIAGLSRETSARFASPAYATALRRVLARDYMLPLMRGLKLSVNGEPVHGRTLVLREGADFKPLRETYADNGVNVEIIAGMVTAPPADSGPDDDDPRLHDASGWYVFCNGRAVLAADTSRITGWGEGDLPKWHRQYSGFAGLVLFSSKDAIKLPMTTTKRSVDEGSGVYRRALQRMAVPTKAWTSYTNTRKNALEEAGEKEQGTHAVPLSAIGTNKAIALPKLRKISARQEIANVNYAVPVKSIRTLAAAFGDITMTYRDAGLKAFDYAYNDLVTDE